jgi:undecaprenyl diphosphate synthase
MPTSFEQPAPATPAPPTFSDDAVMPLSAVADAGERARLAELRTRNPKADPIARLGDVPLDRVPRHVAIIMDGNGRWAQSRGFPRVFGHRNGAAAVRRTIDEAGRLGIEYVTLYSFSIENWKRPQHEVGELMSLYLTYMSGEREHLVRENVRLLQIGRREGLPADALAELDKTLEATRHCTGCTLVLAVNYGSRAEITDAVRDIARRAASGALDPAAIDERTIENALTTRGIPDPDLLIRTAGEMRISNFLLWQISYAELYVTPTLWPDFEASHLRDAVRAYARRDRRFGGLTNPT